MNGTFNGINGAYRLDYGAQIRMEMEAKRQEQDYEARCAAWVASRLVGQTFTSLDALKETAHTHALAVHGELDERQVRALNRGVTAMWAGILERKFLRERGVMAPIVTEPHSVTFLKAS